MFQRDSSTSDDEMIDELLRDQMAIEEALKVLKCRSCDVDMSEAKPNTRNFEHFHLTGMCISCDPGV